VKDGNGRIHVTEYNALNLPWKSYDPAPFDNQYVETSYYRTGKVASVTNRRHKTTTTEYDQLWRATKVTDPLTQTIETTYDNVGNIRIVKDKRDIKHETIYDDLHRQVEKKNKTVGLRLFTYEYDDANNLTAEIDAEQKRTEYKYTPRNLKEKVTYHDSTFKSYTYDPNGNLKTETDEESIVTTHDYDKEYRLTATERAGETTRKHFNPRGDLATIIHPKSNSRTYGYDKLRRMTSVIDDPFGPALTTEYAYDANNNQTKRTDARRKVQDQTYDELNRLTKRIQRKSSGDLTTSFDLYDEEGNLIDLTDPKGQKQHYTYDDLNRRTESKYTDTANNIFTVTTGYDGNNNVTSSSTPSDSTTNIYDDFDRLKSSTQRGTTVSYEYFDNGNRKSVTVNGDTTSYTYHDRNWVKSATANNKTTNFDYFDDGKKKTVTYPNGAIEAYDYDHSTNRVKSITNTLNGAPVSKFEYPDYDHNGNRKRQLETRGARTIATSYDYDTLDRMQGYSVTENNATTKTDYIFDGYNRQTETITKPDGSITSKTYIYDDSDWLTDIADGAKNISYGYDNNGNTTSKTDSTDAGNAITFEYDARDKLTKTSKGLMLLGRYEYNANGYRIKQLNSDRGDIDYYYDGTAVIEERNGSGLLAHYRYANKLYSLTDGTSNQYYHLDALGSTTDLTDDTGTTKASYFLNPWGLILETLGDSVNRRVFTGKEIDQNTGLVYFGARYYDPDTARFTTQDSYLGEQTTPPSLHRYLYAYSNPTVYIDLEGYESIFSKGADFLHGLVTDSKDYVSNLNMKTDKGLGDWVLAATMGIGNTLIEGVAGAADLADLTTDVTLAMNPATQGTEDGEKARKRVKETTTKITLTARKTAEYVTTEDPSAMVQTAKEKLGNYLEKTSIEGDLNYTADFSGKAFGVALGGASVRAAQMSRTAGVVEAAESTNTGVGIAEMKLLPAPGESSFSVGERIISKSTYENYIEGYREFQLGKPGESSFFFNKQGANQATRSFEAAVNSGFTRENIIDTINNKGNELVRLRFKLDKIDSVVPGVSKITGGIGDGVIPGTNNLYTGKGWAKNYLGNRTIDEFIGTNVSLGPEDIVDVKYLGRIRK